MSIKESILKLLYFYPRSYITSEELSKKLGVEKKSIYQNIRLLRKEGYEISGCTNRGYRLSSAENILTAESITKYCGADLNKIRIFKSLPSTNATAKEMAALGAPEGTIIIAETQTEGRGRMQRTFHSPNKSGIYMSIILRPNISPDEALNITTLSAVAVAESIETFTNQPAQIKWVNDIYYKGKKVSGILTESSLNAESQHIDYVVLGIGINLVTPTEGFPEEIKNIAGAIFDSHFEEDRSQFIAMVLQNIYKYYKNISNKAFLEPYRRRSLLTGQVVTVNNFLNTYSATVLGINDDFSLQIALPDGSKTTLSSGEVSVKPR